MRERNGLFDNCIEISNIVKPKHTQTVVKPSNNNNLLTWFWIIWKIKKIC